MSNFKTTSKHFDQFVKDCKKFVNLFGLKDWSIVYLHDELDEETRATCTYNSYSRCATLRLGFNWGADAPITEAIRRTAYHEVLELLLAHIRDIALDANMSKNQRACDLDVEAHAIIRRLENAYMPREYDAFRLGKRGS